LEYMGFGNVAPAPFKVVCPKTAKGTRTHNISSRVLRITRDFLLSSDVLVLSALCYRTVTNQ
jgi:hypothetical protein